MMNIPEQLKIDLGNAGINLNDIGIAGTSTMSGTNNCTVNTSINTNGIFRNQLKDYTITSSNIAADAAVIIDEKGLDIKEGADIKISGKSLSETIEKIEERLGILYPNNELEEKWESLKKLGQQYRELEKEIIQKEKIMDILKEK